MELQNRRGGGGSAGDNPRQHGHIGAEIGWHFDGVEPLVKHKAGVIALSDAGASFTASPTAAALRLARSRSAAVSTRDDRCVGHGRV